MTDHVSCASQLNSHLPDPQTGFSRRRIHVASSVIWKVCSILTRKILAGGLEGFGEITTGLWGLRKLQWRRRGGVQVSTQPDLGSVDGCGIVLATCGAGDDAFGSGLGVGLLIVIAGSSPDLYKEVDGWERSRKVWMRRGACGIWEGLMVWLEGAW
jgi:hypothetical protein